MEGRPISSYVSRRAFEGIANEFLHILHSLFSLIAFWCSLQIPPCIDVCVSFIENHVLM